ncbi:MAG TPA: type II secretion system protein [Thermoanaerobaculia bacterium]|nr:type II secretion system protein [Thermoanaerobaculia bacterium]
MSRTASSDRERGFTLAGLLAVLGVIMIFVTATVPTQWSKVMERERDIQTIFIMKQYARSMRNFQLKHGSLPVSLQQLKDARQPRMIRGSGEWADPLTGEVDWIPIPASAIQGRQVVPGAGGMPPGSQNPQAGRPPITPPAQQPGTSTIGTGSPGTPTPGQPGGMVGPIVGVRPNKTGKSFLTLNGAENYEEWQYTVLDLEQEIMGRRAALGTK